MECSYTKLTEKTIALLQRQVKHELENSNIYKYIANWCEYKNLSHLKEMYLKQSNDEINHYEKFSGYLLDKKVRVLIPSLNGFTDIYANIGEVLSVSLNREYVTTTMIRQIADNAMSEKDYQTFELASFMLKEQVEEEAKFLNLLDTWELLKNDTSAEFLFDVHAKM